MSDNFMLMLFDNLWGDDDEDKILDKDLEEIESLDTEPSDPEDIDEEKSEKE